MKEIDQIDGLSVRAYNLCNYLGLHSVKDIFMYYKEKKSFLGLRNCGQKTNDELIKLCEKYEHYIRQNNDVTELNLTDLGIAIKEEKEIDNLELSVRSYNVCIENGLIKVSDIMEFYDKYGSFYNLKNCGRKSNDELVILCKELKKDNPNEENLFSEINYEQEYFDFKYIQNENEILQQAILDLNSIKKEVLNNFIRFSFDLFSKRSFDLITAILENNFELMNVNEKLLMNKKTNFIKVKNVGYSTIDEIDNFKNKLKEFILSIFKEDDDKKIITINQKFVIERLFEETIFPNDLIENDSVFEFADYLIKHNILFNSNHDGLFEKLVKVYNDTNNESTLEKVGKDYSLTRERIRQIRVQIKDKLESQLDFLKNIDFDFEKKYGIDLNQDLIIISDTLVKKINAISNTNFSKEFITLLTYHKIANKYELIGNIGDVLLLKFHQSKGRHNWSSLYLVKKEISDKINIIDLINDISNRMTGRIESTYKFNIKSYLAKFIIEEANLDYDRIIQPIEKIINEEFEIFIDFDDNITFNKNTKKRVIDYVYEVLEQEGKPLNIYEIFEKINETYPNIIKSANALRGSCINSNKLIYFGRSSTYGLKKWESSDLIKGGTMHDISEEYLSQFDEPKHIDDILKYVSVYRENLTSSKLRSNLFSARGRRFIFFENNYIGLTNKDYSKEFVPIDKVENKKRSWEENYSLLCKFINENNRLPNCMDNELEIKLYAFMRRKTKDLVKENKISELYKKFGKRRKSLKRSSERFQELMTFILNNKRLPKASKTDENFLYQFYKRFDRLNKKNELTKDQEKKFNEIIKLTASNSYEYKAK